MASLTVRKLDEALKAQLRLRAARNGRSVEDEVRVLLRAAAEPSAEGQAGETPQADFEALLRACRPGTRLCVACDLSTSNEFLLTRSVGDWRRTAKPALAKRPTLFLLLA